MKHYIGILYFHSGAAVASRPCDSVEACVNGMKDYIRKRPGKVEATTYITRDTDGPIDLKSVFGSPRSRDLMQDQKFRKELEQ